MIKLTLTVDNELVEKEDIVRALHANDAYLCIDKIKSRFRTINKWGTLNNLELNADQLLMAEMFEKEFLNIIEDLPGRM